MVAFAKDPYVSVAALLIRIDLYALTFSLFNNEKLFTCLPLVENKLVLGVRSDLQTVDEFQLVVCF